MNNLNVLILEDEIIICMHLGRTLQKLGFEHIYTAKTYLEAIELATKHPFHIMLSDIRIKGDIDGITTSKAIQKLHNLALIFITAYNDPQTLSRASEVDFVGYLLKPYRVDELHTLISIAINKYNLLETNLSVKVSGVYHFDTASKILYHKDHPVTLSKKEQLIFALLFNHQGMMIKYNVLDQIVWLGRSVSENTRRTFIYRIKKRFPGLDIQTINNIGIQLETNAAPSIEVLETDSLQQEIDLLKVEKEELIRRSTTDSLTGLYNRVKIQEIFAYEQQQFIRHKDELSVILMDLDDFKSINDTYGHNVGDNYLKEIARVLTEFFRSVDTIGRWGGEEFIILLPKTTLEQCQEIALRFRDKVNAIDCPRIGYQTASFGLSTLTKEDSLDSIIDRADKALYLAKARGKDRVEVFDLGVMNSTV